MDTKNIIVVDDDSDDKVRQEKLEKLSLKREIEELRRRIEVMQNEG